MFLYVEFMCGLLQYLVLKVLNRIIEATNVIEERFSYQCELLAGEILSIIDVSVICCVVYVMYVVTLQSPQNQCRN